jgi:hypothetical protein
VLEQFNAYFDGQSMELTPMITVSNVKVIDVEDTLRDAENAIKLHKDGVVKGRFFEIK